MDEGMLISSIKPITLSRCQDHPQPQQRPAATLLMVLKEDELLKMFLTALKFSLL